MKYFQSGTKGKSYFPIEWTNQHGCGSNTNGDPIKLSCQIVVQYMCMPDDGTSTASSPSRDMIRDGLRTDKNRYKEPPNQNRDRNGKLGESSREFANRKTHNQVSSGMHEPLEWRDKCEARPRNKGLFTADQKLKKPSATATRQNPNGGRSGYECAEERDYYPYWHPTDWKDAVILVEDESTCAGLTSESFNVKSKHECVEEFSDGEPSHYSRAETKANCDARGGEWLEFHNFLEKLKTSNGDTPASKAQCEGIATGLGLKATDVVYGNAIYGDEPECLVKLKKPECKVANYSRVNHLGNSDGSSLKTNNFLWEIPRFPSGETQRCALRLRYNISTEDYPRTADAKSNNNKNIVSQNPQVPVGLPGGQTLRLAINTAQFGRTFQDRSHTFLLEPRKNGGFDDQNSDLYNLNVRGKRGNIVQTYPAVEYDFSPKDLKITTNDRLHIQWTGSNSHNNGGNGGDGQAGDDGEGTRGTDRSNIMSMKGQGKNFFNTFEDPDNLANNAELIWSAKPIPGTPKPIDISIQLATSGLYACYDCPSRDSYTAKRNQQLMRDGKLNRAPASFEGMIIRFKSKKFHMYGCSRNNNFSNRSQKGTITVA